jgi:hypothetical protein
MDVKTNIQHIPTQYILQFNNSELVVHILFDSVNEMATYPLQTWDGEN